ncbi:predicted protein [Arabidopsis lyrata subsp. lyrata]|uniref:Predicted protein n=1 Tax=Arabidopsis lyrata subsp. lyrata TaxID=81972 RepID=D7LW84_ARALL|nr:thylakoid lumenal 17.9 kDa protein, chloroplastic [Arabidopsis lyrata subsp. lyrata]EFH52741.1 predicted protein [Arabidopsis lyrata subsp. lyrata]|eukprot:XP_002876482.1 thylakoid lumenal 17.9 kDa protein, chloroplastic [Arabidopsis lyrata subsp. lyrata]
MSHETTIGEDVKQKQIENHVGLKLSSSSSSPSISLLPKLISFAIALSLTSSSPALAIPSFSSSQPLTTPFSTQSKFVQIGLLNGKIRPCPSTNPGCVSTNPTSSSFSFPLTIRETDAQDPI